MDRAEQLARGKLLRITAPTGEVREVNSEKEIQTRGNVALIEAFNSIIAESLRAIVAEELKEIMADHVNSINELKNNHAALQSTIEKGLAAISESLMTPVQPVYDAKGKLIGAKRVKSL